MISSNPIIFLILTAAYVVYLLFPFMKPVNAIGTVIYVEKWVNFGRCHYLPTIEFVDMHGKRHVIVGHGFSRTIGKFWTIGETTKLYYHPDAPERAMVRPSILNLMMGVLAFAAVALLVIATQYPSF